MDGGRNAARGFFYQYLRTVEAVLVALAGSSVSACRVEGDPNPDEVTGVDAVDFDLIDNRGLVLRSVQVKSGTPQKQLGVGTIFGILLALVNKGEAQCYELLTNTRISPSANDLAQSLSRDHSSDQRRTALQSILRRTNARHHVDDLTDEQLRRLGRCVVSVDYRDRGELNDALRQCLRDARRRASMPLGEQSSGLLLSYLQSEVHRRAATPDDAVWTMDELRETLSLDDRVLADILGRRDWGSVHGPMAPIPVVPRAALLDGIAELLTPYRPAANVVRRCALTGLSGIGKSSLASAYLAEFADAYDATFWIDASTADAIQEGFCVLADSLGIPAGMSTSQLCSAVHQRLSTLTGRWLIVFDDATAATYAPWTPHIGDGDVLITSIDSTQSFGANEAVQVSTMSANEARRLLKVRLNLFGELSDMDAELIDRLALELERWPLALELAASYLHSCGYSISEIPYYLETLKVHSLDDRISIPEGYPRTLSGAIELAVERLHESQRKDIAELAANMLANACYLGGRRIPVHLLVAPAILDLPDLPGDSGPVIFENPAVPEAVRALQGVSLAQRDQSLSKRSGDLPTSDHTVSSNSVLQEVLRVRFERTPEFQMWKEQQLTSLAYHLTKWLATASHNGEFGKVRVLVPHASVLVQNLRRLHVRNNDVALLIGNLADFYGATQRFSDAVALLEVQLGILLELDSPDEFLVHQCRLHLAQTLSFAANTDDPNATAWMLQHLEHILVYCQRLAIEPDGQQAAATFCANSLSALDRISNYGYELNRAEVIKNVFNELLRRLPSTNLTTAREILVRAAQEMVEEKYVEVEESCRIILAKKLHGSNIGLEARRLLVESMIYQARWQDSRLEMDSFAAEIGHDPVYRNTAEIALHNIGLVLAGHAVVFPESEPGMLFLHLMSLPPFVSVQTDPHRDHRSQFLILALIEKIMIRSVDEVRRLTVAVRDISLNDPLVTESVIWRILAHSSLESATRKESV